MKWHIFLIISVTCLCSAIVFSLIKAKAKYKSGRLLDSSKILFIGVIMSSIILFIPVYINFFSTTDCGFFQTFLISIHNMIRLFIVDGEFEFITSNITGVSPRMFQLYTALFSVLFVLAPILTFSFVLTFFKNISVYKKYFAHYNSDVFVFSELNEKSLALAKNLYGNSKENILLVFTDVFEREEEESYELIEQSKEIEAICLKKDIVTINLSFHSKKSVFNFFAIGEDQSENVRQALKIVNKQKYRENTNLYVFSTQIESEMLLANSFNSEESDNIGSVNSIKIRVRCINPVQSLIIQNLYENGYEKIFLSAYDDGEEKQINAIVIGMGKHGTEMTKALSWFCQMDGYSIEINAFDIDPCINQKFYSECPELMKFSGKSYIEGEAKYNINIHSGVDVDAVFWDSIISALPRTTYVFVALGNDERNISTAVKLRTAFERIGYKPEIQAVVYNSDKKEALENVSNFKGQKYDIDYIGDINSSYSEKVIIASEIEAAAIKRHLKWGSESEFWQYNYNYKSSVSSVVHHKMKVLCGIPGAEKETEKRTEQELWNLRKLEHRRWNAYMRSEGYIYGGTTEKSGRNDLAKMHNCLVPFAELPLNEQEKDDD